MEISKPLVCIKKFQRYFSIQSRQFGLERHRADLNITIPPSLHFHSLFALDAFLRFFFPPIAESDTFCRSELQLRISLFTKTALHAILDRNAPSCEQIQQQLLLDTVDKVNREKAFVPIIPTTDLTVKKLVYTLQR